MTNAPDCPASESLERLLEGTLGDDEQAALTGHLDGCEGCQRRLEQVAAGDASLTNIARQLAGHDRAETSNCAAWSTGCGSTTRWLRPTRTTSPGSNS